MKSIIFFICTISLVQLVSSQNVIWQQEYPNNLTLGKAMVINHSNEIISVGNGAPQAAYNEFLYVQKVAADGVLIWRDSVECTVPNNYYSATWVDVDSMDNIFIIGYRFTLSGSNEIPNALRVFKFSDVGLLLQDVTISGVFGSGANFNLGRKNESVIDEYGNLYIATVGSSDSIPSSGFNLFKLDNDCNVLWEKVESFGSIHGLRGMAYSNGRIALIGKTDVSGFQHNIAVWDNDGVLLWSSMFGSQLWFTDVLVDNLGNSYTLSRQYSGSYYVLELKKYNVSGSTLYTKIYDIEVSAAPGRMEFALDGNIIISGTNWTSGGAGKLYVAKVSSMNGDVLVDSEYNLPQINNFVYDIDVAENGNYVIAGKSDNNGGSPSFAFAMNFLANDSLQWSFFYDSLGTIPARALISESGQVYLTIENKYALVKIGNTEGCSDSILLENMTFASDSLLQASFNIQLNNVIVNSPAVLTLSAPNIVLNPNVMINLGASLNLTTNGCN